MVVYVTCCSFSHNNNNNNNDVLHVFRLDVVPKPWNKATAQAYELVSANLFTTNPILAQILNNWYKDYR